MQLINIIVENLQRIRNMAVYMSFYYNMFKIISNNVRYNFNVSNMAYYHNNVS